jgi:hypothetical protein
MRTLTLSLLAATTLVACDAYDTDLGPTPYLCGPTEPKCPDGYSCQDDITTGEQVCVANGGMLSNNFDCADDSATEPNNALDAATATTIDTMKTFSQDNLAICPAGDKDLFALTVSTQNENVELVVDFQNNGATLVGAILNAGGIPIATAAPVTGEPFKIRAFAQNLPTGQYYAQVAAAVSGTLTVNNYKIALTVTGP